MHSSMSPEERTKILLDALWLAHDHGSKAREHLAPVVELWQNDPPPQTPFLSGEMLLWRMLQKRTSAKDLHRAIIAAILGTGASVPDRDKLHAELESLLLKDAPLLTAAPDGLTPAKTGQTDRADSDEVRRIVSRFVDIVNWDGDQTTCVCPGDDEHGPTGARYAKVMLSGRVPMVTCFHASCLAARVATNRDIRAEVIRHFGRSGVEYKPTPEEREERKFAKRLLGITRGARARILPHLQKQAPISLADWEAASPYDVRSVRVREHWRVLLSGLFAPTGEALDEERHPPAKWGKLDSSGHRCGGDFVGNPTQLPYIWSGELYQTGREHFRTCPEWLAQERCPGPQLCPAEFENPVRRAKEHASRRFYLVIESDDLPLETFGNVALYVAEQLKLKLRAIVYTGGRSIHVWLDYNHLLYMGEAKQAHRETKAILTGLGCDPKMFGIAATTRMPGCKRLDAEGNPTGRWQRLVYLDPKFPVKH